MKKLPPNLDYLKYFIDAVKCGSISASARENFVSQSAISQGIAKLENGLGIKLTDHHPNRFRITPEGQHIFEKGIEVFQKIQELECTDELSGSIEFACLHSLAFALLPKILKKVNPDLQVNFRMSRPDVAIEQLKKGLIEFAIVLDNEDLSLFDCYELHKGFYHLYVSTSVNDPSTLPFLIPEERLETTQLKKAFRKKFGKELEAGMTVYSWGVISKLTESGLGIGFFPDYIVTNQSHLKEYDLGMEPISYRILAILPKGRAVPKKVQAFFDLWN